MKIGRLRKSRLVRKVVRWVVRSKALITAGLNSVWFGVVRLVHKTGQVLVRWFGSFRPNQRTSPEIRHFLMVGLVHPNQGQFWQHLTLLSANIDATRKWAQRAVEGGEVTDLKAV